MVFLNGHRLRGQCRGMTQAAPTPRANQIMRELTVFYTIQRLDNSAFGTHESEVYENDRTRQVAGALQAV